MRQWEHGGGFSLDDAVRIEATDRKGWSACCGIVPARSLRASRCSGRSRPSAAISSPWVNPYPSMSLTSG